MSSPALLTLVLLAASNNTFTPTFPFGLIGYIICYLNRRNAIGGFLLFYFWNLYCGILLTLIFFIGNFQSYVPENFPDARQFHLFLLSAVPPLVMSFAEVITATMLLSVRTSDMLLLLRYVIGVSLFWDLVAVAIDGSHAYLQDNLIFGVLSISTDVIWLLYFFLSRRVKHVFKSQDWSIAVNHFYPPKGEPTRLNLS